MHKQRFTRLQTPFGTLYITAEEERIVYIGNRKPFVVGVDQNDSSPILELASKEIKAYLNGSDAPFTFARDTAFSPFQNTVFEAVCRIPYGQSVTDITLAAMIGKPQATKAVATICRCNPLWIAVPSHRVLLQNEHLHLQTTLNPQEVLRRMERRYLDKDGKKR